MNELNKEHMARMNLFKNEKKKRFTSVDGKKKTGIKRDTVQQAIIRIRTVCSWSYQIQQNRYKDEKGRKEMRGKWGDVYISISTWDGWLFSPTFFFLFFFFRTNSSNR